MLSLKTILQKFSKNKNSLYYASLMMTSTAAYLLMYKKGQKNPIHTAEQSLDGSEDWLNCITQILDSTPLLKQASLNVVLPGSQYQLFVADKPDVAESEMAAAIKYTAADYINSPLDEVITEYFDIPVQQHGQNKINLVIANKNFVLMVAKVCRQKCHQLKRITIDELAYEDLFLQDHEASLLVVHHPNEQLLVQIVKEGEIYFFRRIRGYDKLDTFAELEIKHGAADGLSLEIQRSLDYFESQLRQAPVKRIYISVQNKHQNMLIDQIGENFDVPVLPLKNRLVDELPESDNHAYFPAVGAVQELLYEHSKSAQGDAV
ncbi:hypothetical protein ACMZOO_08790 [Catenovulum sp. SX2]|uniref:hypothetical protein n=1 Tax=Catenovulum sp. SX2 TaxID=3398614 RepID=UPI003F854C36